MSKFIKIKEYKKKYKNATTTILFNVSIYTNEEQFIVCCSSSATGSHFGDNEDIYSSIYVTDNYKGAIDIFNNDKIFINSYHTTLLCGPWDDVKEEELDEEDCNNQVIK